MLPSTRSGRKMTSAYRPLSRTSLCIFLSRESLPLFPLVASTMISPPAFPVHGSFAFKKGILQLDTSTGKAGGEIIEGATSGDSGNESPEKKKQKKNLARERYRAH